MDALPRELFDQVVRHLAVYECPFSARFAVLDDASRQSILDARRVARCFHVSTVLKNLFIAVLEETPFLWYNGLMLKLVELSRSPLASHMSTLSICSMDLTPCEHHDRSRILGSRTDLKCVFRRFAAVKHLRCYTVSPKCFREPFRGHKFRCDTGPEAQWGFPADEASIHSWLIQQQELSWICGYMIDNVADAGLVLDSVTFPLLGNRASYCAVQFSVACFPTSLKRLAISIAERVDHLVLFEPWLQNLRNLVFLDVAISRHPSSLGPWNSFAICQKLTNAEEPTARDQLPRLEEFRLMSDNQVCFSERDLLLGLALFPNLRRLGLAHILIKSQLNNACSWESFVRQLIPKNLDRLWLLDPRNLWTQEVGQAGRYMMKKYKIDDGFRAVARNVRLMDTNSLWVDESEPPKTRDFDYPGFAIFEQTPEGSF